MNYQPPPPSTTSEPSVSNPYATPGSNTGITQSEGNSVNHLVVDILRRTRGWALFIAILLFILGVIYTLAGFLNLFVSPLSALFVFVFAFLIIYPGVKLTQYYVKISKLMAVPSEANLITALEQQRAFWKFAGIAGIILILMFVLFAILIGTAFSSFQ